jgi:hypothetical protein
MSNAGRLKIILKKLKIWIDLKWHPYDNKNFICLPNVIYVSLFLFLYLLRLIKQNFTKI